LSINNFNERMKDKYVFSRF